METETRSGELDKVIEVQKTRLDNAISDFQKQFSDTQAQRQEEANQHSQKRSEQYDTWRSGIEKRMQSFLAEREESANTLRSQYKQEVETHINALEKRENEFFVEQEKEAKKRIDALEESKTTGEELLRLVSDFSITGNYANVANADRRTANILRVIALGLMLGICIIAYHTVDIFVNEGFNWKIAIFRMLSIFIVGIPAFYAASESTKHRRSEQHNRKFQLELTAVDPYLQTLSPAKREELKGQLADRFFAQPEPTDTGEDSIKSKSAFGLCETVIKELVKKVR